MPHPSFLIIQSQPNTNRDTQKTNIQTNNKVLRFFYPVPYLFSVEFNDYFCSYETSSRKVEMERQIGGGSIGGEVGIWRQL